MNNIMYLMLKNKYININFIIIFILFINNIHLSYVTIPFKIFREQEPSTYTSIEDFFTYQSDLKYYGQISI